MRLLGALVLGQHRDHREWWKREGHPATGRKHRREIEALRLHEVKDETADGAPVPTDFAAVIAAARRQWETLPERVQLVGDLVIT